INNKTNAAIHLPKDQAFLSPDTHPIQGILEHTDYIGTAEHPTINGGILNQAVGDGSPVRLDASSMSEVAAATAPPLPKKQASTA
ncbi:hypothetical protein ABTK84_19925, partial [Acinetobacter baumannii]